MDGVIVGAVLFGAGLVCGVMLTWLVILQYNQERAELYRAIGQMQMRIEQLEAPGIPEAEL